MTDWSEDAPKPRAVVEISGVGAGHDGLFSIESAYSFSMPKFPTERTAIFAEAYLTGRAGECKHPFAAIVTTAEPANAWAECRDCGHIFPGEKDEHGNWRVSVPHQTAFVNFP